MGPGPSWRSSLQAGTPMPGLAPPGTARVQVAGDGAASVDKAAAPPRGDLNARTLCIENYCLVYFLLH